MRWRNLRRKRKKRGHFLRISGQKGEKRGMEGIKMNVTKINIRYVQKTFDEFYAIIRKSESVWKKSGGYVIIM